MHFDKIICPYCFREFDHSEVLFRAETCFNEDDILEDYEIDMMENSIEKERTRRENELKREFLVGENENYRNYWSKYGGTTEQTRKRASAGSMSQFLENYK